MLVAFLFGCYAPVSCFLNISVNFTVVISGKNFCMSVATPLFAGCIPSR